MKPHNKNTTDGKIQDWNNAAMITGHRSGWALRQILSESKYLDYIMRFALNRSPLIGQGNNDPEEHWSFGLEKLPEEIGINILLSAWSDVCKLITLRSQTLSEIALSEQNHILYDKSYKENIIIGENNTVTITFIKYNVKN